ncbi:356L [Invertebrate iridescent virus 6]|uniref:356L n=1 Tax=Invertebrate iridescent virus 6 TaxID=176652 RepID=Q91FG8_IIV6|nr:356L [Invertebrate iridescent virus 6]AAK82217.1 356L [Invertebrate iridescent virus 6]QMS79553.1 hypothetical protein IIV6-T1_349 [Invertebrate iridescent virus 6]
MYFLYRTLAISKLSKASLISYLPFLFCKHALKHDNGDQKELNLFFEMDLFLE